MDDRDGWRHARAAQGDLAALRDVAAARSRIRAGSGHHSQRCLSDVERPRPARRHRGHPNVSQLLSREGSRDRLARKLRRTYMNGNVIAGGFRQAITRHWLVLLVRCLVSVLFGVMAFGWPGLTLASLVLLYGAYCLVDGVVALFGGAEGKLWQSILIGLVSICAGLVTFFYPGLTALVLLYFIALWAIVRGIFEIAA